MKGQPNKRRVGFPRVAFAARLFMPAVMVAGLLTVAGCGGYDVPGGDRPWPKLSDFPARPDVAAMETRRRRLIGRYGDPAIGLPDPNPGPAAPPAGALRVAVIQFDRASADIDDAARDVLAQAAAYAQQAQATVWLFGYASVHLELATGGSPAETSRALASARVKAVAAVLLDQGVPFERLQLVSRGGADPAHLELSPEGEAANRRVEVHFSR